MVHARLSGRAFDMICLRNEHQILQDTSNNGRFCRVGAQRRVLFAI